MEKKSFSCRPAAASLLVFLDFLSLLLLWLAAAAGKAQGHRKSYFLRPAAIFLSLFLSLLVFSPAAGLPLLLVTPPTPAHLSLFLFLMTVGGVSKIEREAEIPGVSKAKKPKLIGSRGSRDQRKKIMKEEISTNKTSQRSVNISFGMLWASRFPALAHDGREYRMKSRPMKPRRRKSTAGVPIHFLWRFPFSSVGRRGFIRLTGSGGENKTQEF